VFLSTKSNKKIAKKLHISRKSRIFAKQKPLLSGRSCPDWAGFVLKPSARSGPGWAGFVLKPSARSGPGWAGFVLKSPSGRSGPDWVGFDLKKKNSL